MRIYLDLLPEDRKKRIARNKNFRIMIEQGFFLLFPVFVYMIILSNVLLILSMKKESIELENFKQSSQAKYQELDEYEKEIISMNSLVDEISKIQKKHLYWTDVLSELEKSTPAGMTITDLTTKDYRIMLAGRAKTRESLVDFKEKMNSGGCFENLNVPLSNLVDKENIAFQVDFSVKKECLVGKK